MLRNSHQIQYFLGGGMPPDPLETEPPDCSYCHYSTGVSPLPLQYECNPSFSAICSIDDWNGNMQTHLDTPDKGQACTGTPIWSLLSS